VNGHGWLDLPRITKSIHDDFSPYVIRAVAVSLPHTEEDRRSAGPLVHPELPSGVLGGLPALGQCVLDPGERDEEEWRQEHAEQRVDPDQRDVERSHRETRKQRAEWPAKAVFHVSVRSEKVEGAPCTSCASIS